MVKNNWVNSYTLLFGILIIGVVIGVIFVINVIDVPNFELLNDNTLVINESNDWYWLQSHDFLQTKLNEFDTLKNILISNECPDGGFIENLDGNEFLIICYQPQKTIKSTN